LKILIKISDAANVQNEITIKFWDLLLKSDLLITPASFNIENKLVNIPLNTYLKYALSGFKTSMGEMDRDAPSRLMEISF